MNLLFMPWLHGYTHAHTLTHTHTHTHTYTLYLFFTTVRFILLYCLNVCVCTGGGGGGGGLLVHQTVNVKYKRNGDINQQKLEIEENMLQNHNFLIL